MTSMSDIGIYQQSEMALRISIPSRERPSGDESLSLATMYYCGYTHAAARIL
jgi:hypothetical protein